MKSLKSFLFVFISVVTVINSFGQYTGTTFAEASQTKKANLVCVYSETPGYITSSENKGKPVGVLPEIMSSYAAYLKSNNGIEVTYTFQAFKKDAPISEIFDKVNSSQDGVFGLVFIFITPERKKTLNMSSTIFESPSFLLTSNTVPDIATMDEATTKLKGFTAYVNQGNFFEDRFKELKA